MGVAAAAVEVYAYANADEHNNDSDGNTGLSALGEPAVVGRARARAAAVEASLSARRGIRGAGAGGDGGGREIAFILYQKGVGGVVQIAAGGAAALIGALGVQGAVAVDVKVVGSSASILVRGQQIDELLRSTALESPDKIFIRIHEGRPVVSQ